MTFEEYAAEFEQLGDELFEQMWQEEHDDAA